MTWTSLPAGTLGSMRCRKRELLMAVAGVTFADHLAVEHVERRKQRGGAIALVVVRHGSAPAFLQRQPRLGAVQRLDLALFIERMHAGVGRRIAIEPDHFADLVDEVRIVRELGLPVAVWL